MKTRYEAYTYTLEIRRKKLYDRLKHCRHYEFRNMVEEARRTLSTLLMCEGGEVCPRTGGNSDEEILASCSEMHYRDYSSPVGTYYYLYADVAELWEFEDDDEEFEYGVMVDSVGGEPSDETVIMILKDIGLYEEDEEESDEI